MSRDAVGAARPVLRGDRRGNAAVLPDKRQATKAGIGFIPLDNGFASVDDVAALQAICDSLGGQHIEALLRKWLKILPHPFTPADEDAGYRYELSILQAEFSLTQMLDRPVSGRIFFEQVLRDNLDIGRPDQIGLVFDRRIIRKGRHATPGRFRTRVLTQGVVPSLHVDYKNAKIKQYHKECRALRTETTINDARDFGLSKGLTDQNLTALRQIGFSANRRLLDVQRISHDPIRGAAAFTELTTPITTDTGTRIPGLRFGDPRVHALLQALLIHRLLLHGFTNHELRTLIAPLLGTTTEDWAVKKVTDDMSGRFAFNIAIAALMELINECSKALQEGIDHETVKFALSTAASLLLPFAPHIASECYYRLTGEHVWEQPWPEPDEALLRTETVELACQVNGKIRGRISVAQEASDDAIREAALRLEEVQQAIADRSVKRVVVVPGRLVSIVVG